MTEIEKSRVEKIAELHREIDSYLKTTLNKAIEIGGLLTEQKTMLGHGQWLPWIKKNLPFSERLARDYMRFHDHRDELKTAKVADLTEARKLLSKSDNDDPRKLYTAAIAEIKRRIPTETDISQLQTLAENLREIGTLAFQKTIELEGKNE
jgi:hypothetical protein